MEFRFTTGGERIVLRQTREEDAAASDRFSLGIPLPVDIIGAVMTSSIPEPSISAAVDDDGDVHTMVLETGIGLYARYSRTWVAMFDISPIEQLDMVAVPPDDLEHYDQADDKGATISIRDLNPIDSPSISAVGPGVTPPIPVTASVPSALIVSSAADLPDAIAYAATEQGVAARWYVARRAKAFGPHRPAPVGGLMKPRSFPVPLGARTALLGETATADQLDLAASLGSAWARGVVAKENDRVLHRILGDDLRLPLGMIDDDGDDLIVTGLVRDGHVLTASGWEPSADPLGDLIGLDSDEVAFVARALIDEGCTAVVLRGYTPVAMLAATEDSSAPDKSADKSDLPAGARVLAVVDDLDRNAVLEVVAVLPGPKVLRRHDGTWQEDDQWVNVLRSVKPPPVVALDETQVASVLPQVDEQTKGQPFLKEPAKKKTTVASAFDERADEMAIEFALLAASPIGKAMSKMTPGGRMPPALQRYWLAGPGAGKIRWFSPGAWRRCHRNLSKYVGPFIAKGLCTNLSMKLGGPGVATHVG